MIDEDLSGGWAHFEWKKNDSWLRKIFPDNNYFLDVAYDSPSHLSVFIRGYYGKAILEKLNQKNIELDNGWNVEKGLIHLETSEVEKLIEWMDQFFIRGYGCPSDYQVYGYLDGI